MFIDLLLQIPAIMNTCYLGRSEGTGFYRSYLARAECMAHLGEQRAAILDFSAAIEVRTLMS